MGLLDSLDLNNFVRHIESRQKVVGRRPWEECRYADDDRRSVADKAKELGWSKSTRLLANAMTQSILGAEVVFVAQNLNFQSHEVSLLYFLWYINNGNGFNCITDHAQTSKFIGGTQQAKHVFE
jgi:hypothetical protein